MIRFKYSLIIILTTLVAITFTATANGKIARRRVTPTIASNNKILWDRIVNDFQLPDMHKHKRVMLYIKKYKNQSHNIKQISHNALPFLYHITENLKKRNLPGELVILPMIESAYKPSEISNKGAVGLWQIWPITGKRFGLQQSNLYDARKDIQASTNAALDYLEFLYKRFDNNWLLTLAAYNSGEGRVRKAIKKNIRLNKPTDFWSLPLPQQTKDFVPKLLALAYLIKHSDSNGVMLHQIEDQPYFVSVSINKPMHLKQIAKLAKAELKELKRLNPAFSRDLVTVDQTGSRQILIPIKNVVAFKANLHNRAISHHLIHTVKRGDTLSLLANHYRTTVKAIKVYNNLINDTIVLGKKLIIPSGSMAI